MKSLALSAVALSTVVAPALAAEDLKVVNFENLQLKPRDRFSDIKFIQGRGTVEVPLSNQQNLYAINLKVGTPAQNISVQIDTGSSDLWFPVTGSTLCNLKYSQCDDFGSYSSGSSTVKNLGQTFSISYGDGTKIRGTFVTDNIQVGSTSLKAVQFAACNSGSSSTGVQGILGIGYETNEATAASGSGGTYPNFLASMKSQGFINTLAYSLWLNDPDSAAGNVLFGGVDLDKFTGSLISMPVIPSSGNSYTELSMPLTGVSFSAGSQNFTFTPSTFFYPALIDSGTTLMYLPDDVAQALWRSLGVTTKSQIPLLPCNYGNDQTAKMTFSFNGPNGAKIDVLLADLLSDVGITLSGGQEACRFLVSGGAPDGLIILGDAFMRSAYIAYDLENNAIAIAQAKFNVTSSNIKEINSNGIPSATVMSTLVGATAVATSVASGIPGAGGAASSYASGGGATGALETTARVPSFTFNPSAQASSTKNAAPLSAKQAPLMSIFGVLAGTVTLLSVCGGALIVWL